MLGSLIIDNVIFAYGVQHFMRRKTKGIEGYRACKVDISKVYDRVEWLYLDILLKMGVL